MVLAMRGILLHLALHDAIAKAPANIAPSNTKSGRVLKYIY
jgi:hypothetical protein